MQWVIHNDVFYDTEQPIFSVRNRAWAYGDGIFETMRVLSGHLHLWEDHRVRIISSLRTLAMEPPEAVNNNTLPQLIQQLCRCNNIQGNARIRVSFYREAGGLYTPESHFTNYLLEASPLSSQVFELNESGLVITTLYEPLKMMNKLANIKTISSLPYIYAGISKMRYQVDDILLTNMNGNIAEGLSTNVFLVGGDTLFTPPLSEGCVEGVMRNHVLRLAEKEGMRIQQSPLHWEAPLYAEELFLTNAVQGIQWVAQHGLKQYVNSVAQELSSLLNRHIESSSTSLLDQ